MQSRREMHQSVDAQLMKFGESLNPSHQFYEEGKRLAQNVFILLQKLLPRKHSVAEPRFAGSFAKGTSVIEPDLDLYLVVNKCSPPFDVVLDEMEKILEEHQNELEIQAGSINQAGKEPKVSIQFLFRNGMEVDLLPAAKMSPVQILAEIAKNPETNYYIYNASLVSVQLSFLKSQDSFTHSLIRISKFWFKSLCFGTKSFRGGSTIMELVGCASAMEEKMQYHIPSMLRAFGRVIDMICDIDSLKLVFERVSSPKEERTWWQRVPLNTLANKSDVLVPNVVGTQDILNRERFIIEPANPFYDHLNLRNAMMLQKLQNFANETKLRLAEPISSLYPQLNTTITFDFAKIFEEQPSSVSLREEVSLLEFPQDFCITVASQHDLPTSVTTSFRKDDICTDRQKRSFINTIKWKLLCMIHIMVYSSTLAEDERNITLNDNIKKGVENLLMSVFDISSIPVWADQNRHDQMDVTINIPYTINNDTYAAKFSMSWSNYACNIM